MSFDGWNQLEELSSIRGGRSPRLCLRTPRPAEDGGDLVEKILTCGGLEGTGL